MAGTGTNTQAVYIATAAIARIKDVKFQKPNRKPLLSDLLNEDVPTVVGMGSYDGPFKLDVTVEIDGADTAGQVALITAWKGKLPVANVKYYPEGNTTGNDLWTGTAYVTSVPDSGGQGKNAVKTGVFSLIYSDEPVKTTVSV